MRLSVFSFDKKMTGSVWPMFKGKELLNFSFEVSETEDAIFLIAKFWFPLNSVHPSVKGHVNADKRSTLHWTKSSPPSSRVVLLPLPLNVWISQYYPVSVWQRMI